MRRISAVLAFLLTVVSAPVLRADTVLNDWCFNVNGNINYCNGGAGATPPHNGAGFDTTLSPANNTLGTVTFALGSGAGQFVLAYMDYEVSFNSFGSFDDSGAVHGARPANTSFGMDDPNSSNIFTDFAGDALSNTNNVGTPGGPPAECCDVAWAIGLKNLNGPGTVSIRVGTTAPAVPFYLSQTNTDTGVTVYLSETFTPSNTGGIPEPSTWMFSVVGFGLLSVVARRRRLRN